MCTCEMPDAFVQIRRKARVWHKCCECHIWIQPGQTYEYSSGVWDGDVGAYKTCLACAALRKQIAADSGECGPCFTELREAAYEGGYMEA